VVSFLPVSPPRPYILTPWCRVLLENLNGLQLVKKFTAFHGTRRFITALTSVRHLSLSWASPIQSIYPHPTSWRSILILSTHLRLGLPSGLILSGFPTKTLYLLTYSMVQSPSQEANWFAASQEIPRISRNPKVHYRTHKRPPPVPILGQPNPVHIPTSHLLEIRPNIIHPSTPRYPQWSLSLRFPYQDPIHPLSSPIRATCPAHLILLHFITRKILGEEYTLSFLSSRNVSDQVSHPNKTTGKITVLYILVFKFLDSNLEDKRFCTE